MTLSPVLIEALESIAVAAIASGFAAPLASALKRVVSGGERTVAVRLPSGREVRLDLDSHLSSDKVSELVAAAVRSAKSGDEAAVQRTIDASPAALQEARAAAE